MGVMDYPLAKELENAGFPQGGKGSFVAPPDKIVVRREDRVYCPTLSELMEACGEAFIGLHRRAAHTWVAYDGLWVNGEMGIHIEVTSPTAEEAVARLWLA